MNHKNNLAPEANGATAADFTRTTTLPFADVVNAVQDAAKEQGFRIPHVHDLAAAMRMGGFEREPYAVIELCRADTAYGVVKAEPRFGALMPCRIAVYPQGDETIVTTVLPSHLLAFFPVNDDVTAAAKHVDRLLITIIEDAIA